MKLIGKDYTIYFKKFISADELIMHDLAFKKKYSDKVEELIETAWNTVKQNEAIYIFNGPVACLDHYELKENKLHIHYYESDYKSYYGTNICHAHILDDSKDLANTLAVCTIVETSDQQIIVGKRGKHLAEGTCMWHIPGGTLEYGIKSGVHPFSVMRKELQEELCLSQIDYMVCLGMGENLKYKKPEFLLYSSTPLTSQEIAVNLKYAQDQEHSEILFIPTNQIENFIKENSFTEIGTACITLYLEMRDLIHVK